MRRHQAGAAALAAATVLLSASTSGPVLSRTVATTRPEVSPAVVIADVPARYSFDDLAPTEAAALESAAPAVPVGTTLRKPPRPPRGGANGSSPPAGTPQAVLAAAYRKAVAKAPRSCHLRVEHLAAIGQVESGSIGGRTVTSGHRVTPAIYGPLLDGGPFAVVHDSDGGSYDGDGQYDRAMGPLQFLPGTWRWAGRDGDGDGRRDPQNVFDAALATAGYLCLEGRDLSRPGDLRSAVLSYNQSGDYHAAVAEWVAYFHRHGLAALTTVAFRVGSGGRASALVEPDPEPEPPEDDATNAPTRATTQATTEATTKPRPSASATSPGPTPAAAPTTAPIQPSPPPTTSVPQPTVVPTTPVPAQTTTTTPAPVSTTPPDPPPAPGG
jgi:hypothetical protein